MIQQYHYINISHIIKLVIKQDNKKVINQILIIKKYKNVLKNIVIHVYTFSIWKLIK